MNDLRIGRADVAGPGATPAPSGRANPGRLGVLSEVAALLGDEPEAPATLQAVVDGALRATAADRVQLVLADAGGRGPAAYAAGGDATGPSHEAPLRAGGLELGALTLARAAGREPFAEADVLFATTLAGQVAGALDAARLRRAEQAARPERQRAARAFSHELRSPLATLRGFLDVIGRGPLTEDQRTFVSYAERNTRKLQELADELVALTRLETDTSGEPVAVTVAEVARERLAACGLRGTVAVPEHLRARIVPGRLEPALDALLENARAYSPPGSPVLVTATERAGMAVIAVDDTGPGVAEDEREAIFARFVRGSAAAATGAPGHGLGLAVVAVVAEAAGGRAWCESAPGGGARFALSLPATAGASSGSSPRA